MLTASFLFGSATYVAMLPFLLYIMNIFFFRTMDKLGDNATTEEVTMTVRKYNTTFSVLLTFITILSFFSGSLFYVIISYWSNR